MSKWLSNGFFIQKKREFWFRQIRYHARCATLFKNVLYPFHSLMQLRTENVDIKIFCDVCWMPKLFLDKQLKKKLFDISVTAEYLHRAIWSIMSYINWFHERMWLKPNAGFYKLKLDYRQSFFSLAIYITTKD